MCNSKYGKGKLYYSKLPKPVAPELLSNVVYKIIHMNSGMHILCIQIKEEENFGLFACWSHYTADPRSYFCFCNDDSFLQLCLVYHCVHCVVVIIFTFINWPQMPDDANTLRQATKHQLAPQGRSCTGLTQFPHDPGVMPTALLHIQVRQEHKQPFLNS